MIAAPVMSNNLMHFSWKLWRYDDTFKRNALCAAGVLFLIIIFPQPNCVFVEAASGVNYSKRQSGRPGALTEITNSKSRPTDSPLRRGERENWMHSVCRWRVSFSNQKHSALFSLSISLSCTRLSSKWIRWLKNHLSQQQQPLLSLWSW